MTKLEEIREYLSKMTPGEWNWSKCYEMARNRGGYDKHWAIENEKSKAAGRVIGLPFVSLDCWTNEKEWNSNPDVAGIARLRTDAEWLLKRCEELEKGLRKLPEIALSWSNNLAGEWQATHQTVTIYGIDVNLEISDEAKRYAAEILANVWHIQQAEAERLLKGGE